jgi:RHS repeat-associated protein
VARLTGTWLKNSGNTILDSATYGYNAGNQRTTFTNAAGTYVAYTYDAIGQLKVADSSVNTEDRGYLYDAAWNLSTRTNNGATTTFTVDTKNELTNIAGASYTYDGNGNLTWGYNSHTNYVYDDENRLVQWFSYATSFGPPASGDLRTDFVYDGLSRLRSRSEYQYIGTGWYPNGTTYYIYDGRRVIQERTTAPTVSYTRGPDLSGALEGAGGIGGLLARSTGYSGGWTNHWCYHADGNGNITYLADVSQALAASYRYDPFGNTTSSSGAQATANTYRFSSKEIHVTSGLYYYGYRFYDPNSQRWLNRDPIGEFGGINLYDYVANNPVDRVDAFGHAIGWDCIACAAAIAGKLGGIAAGCASGCRGAHPFGQCVSDCVRSSLGFDSGNPGEWAGYLACVSCGWRWVFKANRDPLPCPPKDPTLPPSLRPPPIGPGPGRGPVGPPPPIWNRPVGPPPPNNGPGTPPWSNN